MIEVLSPVGSPEVLVAAVRSGADAVYLGMGDFNARRNAHNFTPQNLTEAVEYCHIRGVKVYLTLNTLVYTEEMSDAMTLANLALSAGVDGFILADLGLTSALRNKYPTLPLHASTQLTVHTPEALEELKNLGFSRVVPSREMSRDELIVFCKKAKELEIEVEVFIHGSLCMSMSGQCLMSATLGGRSGNRGLCAGTCRLPWKSGNRDYALSLCDLSLIEHINELEEIGVCSFKIEGRMKAPEYVAAVTAATRSAADNGLPDPELMTLCENIFSRSGFTKGYYEGKISPDMFGIRTEENVDASKEVQNKIHNLYRTERQSVAIDMEFTARFGKPSRLKISDGEFFAEVLGDIPEAARNRALDADYVKAQLSKLGNTPYLPRGFICNIDEGLSLSASSLNALRREAVEALSKQRATFKDYKTREISLEETSATAENKTPKIVAKFRTVAQIPENLQRVDAIILPAEEVDKYEGDLPLIADIPRGMSNKSFIEKCFQKANNRAAAVYVGNLAAINLAKKRGIPYVAGTGMNVLNRLSLAEMESSGAKAVTLSYEVKQSELRHFGSSVPTGLVVYGRMPLMLTRNCPLKTVNCGSCSHRITDRKGIDFPVYCRGGYSEIFNSRPTWLADRLSEFSAVDFHILEFTTEDKAECERIIEAYQNSLAPVGEYTRGLYGKGVL